MAQASLVLGILSLIFTILPAPLGILGFILAIAGVVTGALGRKNQPEYYNTATAGLVLSAAAIILRLIVFIACSACVIGILALI